MRIEEDVKLDFSDVLLVPKRSSLNSRSEVNIERDFNFKHYAPTILCCPVISSNMYNTGTFAMAAALNRKNMLCSLHKYYSVEELIAKYNWNCIPSFGVSDYDKINKFLCGLIEFYNQKEKLFRANICIDVPNGYIPKVSDLIKNLRDSYQRDILITVGNVVTPNMVEQLIFDGADIVKIGIGSGAHCTTRLVAGVGYPQLSAIAECADAAHGLSGHIMSDGGITCVGDICKAFCAGADFVMIGTMFMGYEENEGEWITRCRDVEDEKVWLKTFGMSSKYANEKFAGGLRQYRATEGREAKVKYKGFIGPFLQEIEGGLRSCGTYIGAKRIKDFPKCSTFIKVNNTHNRMIENGKENDSL